MTADTKKKTHALTQIIIVKSIHLLLRLESKKTHSSHNIIMLYYALTKYQLWMTIEHLFQLNSIKTCRQSTSAYGVYIIIIQYNINVCNTAMAIECFRQRCTKYRKRNREGWGYSIDGQRVERS